MTLFEMTGRATGLVLYGVSSLGYTADVELVEVKDWRKLPGLPSGELIESFDRISTPDIGYYLDVQDGRLPPGLKVPESFDVSHYVGKPGAIYEVYTGEHRHTVVCTRPRSSAAVRNRYDSKTFDVIRAKLPKQLAEEFKAAVQSRGDTIAGVLKAAVEEYLKGTD